MRFAIITTFLAICLVALAEAQEKSKEKLSDQSITAKTSGLEKLDGYMPLFWDKSSGKLLMEISRFDTEFLYQVSLPAGVGSNSIGLDRGQLGGTHVVQFERTGPKVLMIEQNYRFRALSEDAAERRAVEDSFARSVLWGFTVEATEGDRVLVDATKFFLHDARGITDRLRETEQGRFTPDESRSALYLPRTKNFPFNTEVEAVLTFAAEGSPGPLVRETVPAPHSVTVREHHSFVQLPDNNYKPRKLDPRVGVFAIHFYDYASSLSEPVEKRWIVRHRLQKKDPSAEISEAVKPIIYYVDNGAPEPIRSALLEGATWWNQAFEAAGFKNAFQVRVLPAGADPMDVRYNIINWVHRSSRGWSYGDTVTDPRTGEIIKGNVTIGSLRARQDYQIASGLVPQYASSGIGTGAPGAGCSFGMTPDADYLADFDPSTSAVALSIARLKQLAAHEVGHTLGLSHNFAASSYGRASVMDYPAPMVDIKNGKLDLSNAYSSGIGAYDKFAIRYAYSQFPANADEQALLEKILSDGSAAGMLFISDADARPPWAAHPLANLWDNGSDPIAMLRHEMDVRRLGISQFGMRNIARGAPLSTLEAKFLPLYLHHRYQLQAAVKSLGGVYYTYAVKTANGTDPTQVQQVVTPDRQRQALVSILETLNSEELAIPPRVLDLITPTAFGYQGGPAELFSKRTDPVFDPIAAAAIAADLAISALLEPHRAARLIHFHSRDKNNPDFKEVVTALVGRTWFIDAPRDAYRAAIMREVQSLVVTRLMDTASNPDASAQVRATANEALHALNDALRSPSQDENAAHRMMTREDIQRFLSRQDAPRKRPTPLPLPPGDPIGAAVP